MCDLTAGHRWYRCLVLLLITICASRPGSAHDAHDKPDPPMFVFDRADRTAETTMAGDALSYDADVLTRADGTTVICWLQYVPHEGDTIWLGNWTTDGVADARSLDGQPGQYARPTLTETDDGALWLSYEQQVDGQWDVLLRRELGDGEFGEPRRVGESPRSDFRHQVAVAGDALWFVWQSDRQGQFDIACRRVTDDSLGESMYVSDSPRGDWHPQIAVSASSDGQSVFVGWDRFDGESYDAMLRIGQTGDEDGELGWTRTLTVAGSPAFEGRVQLATAAGGVWIGWEEGAENWGQPYRARRGQEELYLNLGDHHGPLHTAIAVCGWATYRATERSVRSHTRCHNRRSVQRSGVATATTRCRTGRITNGGSSRSTVPAGFGLRIDTSTRPGWVSSRIITSREAGGCMRVV